MPTFVYHPPVDHYTRTKCTPIKGYQSPSRYKYVPDRDSILPGVLLFILLGWIAFCLYKIVKG